MWRPDWVFQPPIVFKKSTDIQPAKFQYSILPLRFYIFFLPPYTQIQANHAIQQELTHVSYRV